MLDPSTNTNPLAAREGEDDDEHAASDKEKKRKKKRQMDVSKHTFYIENSQMRLKLFARNEVSTSFVSALGVNMTFGYHHSVKCYNGSLPSRESLLHLIMQVGTDSTALHRFD